MSLKLWFAAAFALVAGPMGAAWAEDFSPFADPQGHFRIDLPTTSFHETSAEHAPGHQTFAETDGSAVIDIYAGRNAKHLTLAAFAAQLSSAGEIKDITYRAPGRTWFVISGHYAEDDALITYGKYMFSADAAYVAGFEISYAADEKARMDPIVTRLERSFRVF